MRSMRRMLFPLVALLAASALAQTAPEQTLTESYSVGYVMVPFTVLGAGAAAVKGSSSPSPRGFRTLPIT